MGYFIGNNGYYEGDRASADDAEVPRRPDSTYDWDGIQWVQNAARAVPAADPITALANSIKNDPNGLAAIKQVLGL